MRRHQLLRQRPEGREGVVEDCSVTQLSLQILLSGQSGPSKDSAIPTNHGIYRKLPIPLTSGQRLTTDEAMVFRCGIWRIFGALKAGPFLVNPDDRQRAAQLEYHFRTLCQRFVFTLQQLNGLMQALIQSYSHEQVPFGCSTIHFQAESLADHVLTYLNTMVDDIAIVTALATGFTSSDSIDNMGKLRSPQSKVRKHPALAPVKALLDDLEVAGSWWELAFKKERGARQLLIHNQHLVSFQVSSAPGGPFEARAVVMSPFAQNTFAHRDFFGLLRDILSGLFAWLDRLEAALTTHLLTKSVDWEPIPTCPSLLLPVGYPEGITRYDRDYFPIPLCDGSDELPWSVSVPSTQG